MRRLPPFGGVVFRKGVERAKGEVREKPDTRRGEGAVLKDEEGDQKS